MVKKLPTDAEDVCATLKDCINAIAERDIYTGDNCHTLVLDKNGFREMMDAVRRD